jgi:predicted nucleic acid-binding Zn ribbon protein
MRKVGNMLKDALGRDEILRTARAQNVLRSWPEVVGEQMARKSAPDRFTNGTVWVAVSGSAWAAELRLQRDEILRKLNDMSGEKMFVNIRFGQRPMPALSPFSEPAAPNEEEDSGPLPLDTPLTIREIVERRMRIRRERGA